jgi:hypothetical protein
VLLEERFKILAAPGRWSLRFDSGFDCEFGLQFSRWATSGLTFSLNMLLSANAESVQFSERG